MSKNLKGSVAKFLPASEKLCWIETKDVVNMLIINAYATA